MCSWSEINQPLLDIGSSLFWVIYYDHWPIRSSRMGFFLQPETSLITFLCKWHVLRRLKVFWQVGIFQQMPFCQNIPHKRQTRWWPLEPRANLWIVGGQEAVSDSDSYNRWICNLLLAYINSKLVNHLWNESGEIFFQRQVSGAEYLQGPCPVSYNLLITFCLAVFPKMSIMLGFIQEE